MKRLTPFHQFIVGLLFTVILYLLAVLTLLYGWGIASRILALAGTVCFAYCIFEIVFGIPTWKNENNDGTENREDDNNP